jgi:hypothetical protein
MLLQDLMKNRLFNIISFSFIAHFTQKTTEIGTFWRRYFPGMVNENSIKLLHISFCHPYLVLHSHDTGTKIANAE